MSTQTLSLHRRSLFDSLFLCLSVPHYQSEGLPWGPAGRVRICICIFFCQYLLWTEDQELTGEKKQAADWHLLKTFISPNLVPPVILERPLWPVGAGEGHGCWRDDGFSACGEQIRSDCRSDSTRLEAVLVSRDKEPPSAGCCLSRGHQPAVNTCFLSLELIFVQRLYHSMISSPHKLKTPMEKRMDDMH